MVTGAMQAAMYAVSCILRAVDGIMDLVNGICGDW